MVDKGVMTFSKTIHPKKIVIAQREFDLATIFPFSHTYLALKRDAGA